MPRFQRSIRTASPTLRNLFEEMADRGISQRKMADALTKHQNQVHEWSSGKVEPGIMTVEAMAQELGYQLKLVPLGGKADA